MPDLRTRVLPRLSRSVWAFLQMLVRCGVQISASSLQKVSRAVYRFTQQERLQQEESSLEALKKSVEQRRQEVMQWAQELLQKEQEMIRKSTTSQKASQPKE